MYVIKLLNQIRMQFSIKVKFDKKNLSLWDKNSNNNYYLQNAELKNGKQSPEIKQLHSFREFREDHLNDNQQQLLTDRAKKKEHVTSPKKRGISTSKKKSRHKNTKIQTPITTLKIKKSSSKQKPSTANQHIKKNISDHLAIKMPKKKIGFTNHSNLVQSQNLTGSLPGISGQNVLQRFAPLLSQNQKMELINEKTVYYIGVGTNGGQDDLEGRYLWKKHQQIGYRYQLLQALGSGAFGQVIKAYDHKNKQNVAVKIIRSKKQHMQLALNQINILMKAKQKDLANQKNILRIKDFIVFRRHICIVTELLSMSLYELMESNQFSPIDLTYIRTFAIQILYALAFLKQNNIIHSDLKPENIMLKNKSKTGVKLIDFGTSLFSQQTSFLYIQSRFYRAPQVILGGKYSFPIDMWSFGCLLAELYLGQPLFSGANQQQQINLIIQALGVPSKQFLKTCKNHQQYFNKDLCPKLIKIQGTVITPDSKPLVLTIQNKNFCHYLNKILVIEPKKRYTPFQALMDPWIIEGLPQSIKQQHLRYVKMKLKKEEDIIKKVTKNIQLNSTVKKHKKRISDLQGQNFNAKQAHLKHKRRGSQGIF